eukprot:scaffold357454_cov31-Prasinocladus_malaysianus.AAC.1
MHQPDSATRLKDRWSRTRRTDSDPFTSFGLVRTSSNGLPVRAVKGDGSSDGDAVMDVTTKLADNKKAEDLDLDADGPTLPADAGVVNEAWARGTE